MHSLCAHVGPSEARQPSGRAYSELQYEILARNACGRRLTKTNVIRMTAEAWVAVCTGALAFATAVLAFLTYRLELTWTKSSSRLHGDDRSLFGGFEKLAQ